MAEPEAPGDGDATRKAAESDKEAASRTFFTTIDAEQPAPKGKKESRRERNKFKTLEATSAGPRITEHFGDLVTLAQSLDQRMAKLLQEHEKDFFLPYKTHMYMVQKEIKALRNKADQMEANTREDTKIKALEGELDWFMTEALRLDELCKGYKKEVDKWRAKAEALDEDRRFLEDQIKGAKRQNKILRAAAERARSSAYSALMATKAKAEAGPGGYPGGAEKTFALTQAPAAPTDLARPASAGASGEAWRPAAGSGAKRVLEMRSRTPEAGQGLSNAMEPRGLELSNLEMSRASLLSAAAKHPLGNDAEQRYVDAITHLKESITREQATVRMLQAARSSSYSHKSEQEEFFLKCIDEPRRELGRRRHMTLNKEKTEKERVMEAMLNNEDVLVSLYEKLFPHRTGIARSMSGLPGAGGQDQRSLTGHGTTSGR